jgi:tagaturonate reductase
MNRLNRDLAEEKKLLPVQNSETIPERILQFGEGGFLRAHVDWMIDNLNEKTSFKGRVVLVQPIKTGMLGELAKQDYLYTLFLRGLQDGKVYNEKRVISSISRGINPYDEYAAYLETARNPAIRFIFSNTTEAGIVYTPEGDPRPANTCPASFPAKLTAWLWERYSFFKGDTAGGCLIIPCELIEFNGVKLRDAIRSYAADWNLGADFVSWLEAANTFTSTLVDRVVSGYPKDEAAAITAELGYEDKLLDVGEYFHLLAIQGDKKFEKELPFTDAGLNGIWTGDVTPYRSRKVKLLNGAHTSVSLAGYLAGLETVREYTEDPVLGKFLEKCLFEELVPTVNLPEAERRAFASAVVERFKNPFVKHLCLSIALNSVSKYKVRVLPSLVELIQKQGRVPRGLSFALAALIVFYRVRKKTDGNCFGRTACGREYPIQDDPDVLETFDGYWNRYRSSRDAAALIREVLSNTHFWDQDLTTLPGLADAVTAHVRGILKDGINGALQRIL